MTTARKHGHFMRECLRLARKGQGHVSPNPLVGSILTLDGKIVARGYHQEFGGPHAEVQCLRKFGGDTSRATLYVNLEPCSYFGKTPPCTDLILQRGIRHVVVATKDPNPRIAGKGLAKLRRAGMRVEVGVLQTEAERLNRFFFKHVITELPYVHMKIAQSRDGFIASDHSRSPYLTSLGSRRLVHHWRAEFDAVLVGARTIAADDPRLDIRYGRGRNPAVIVLDGRFSVSEKSRIFDTAPLRRVFICTSVSAAKRHQQKRDRLLKKNVIVLEFPSRSPRLNLRSVLKELYRHRIGSILVEGGAEIFSAFVLQKLVDELSVFVSPVTLGSGTRAMTDAAAKITEQLIDNVAFAERRVGRDRLISGVIR